MPVGRHFQAGIVAGALALGSALAGCGGDDGDAETSGDPPAAGLAAGLEGVNFADSEGPFSLTWADTARLREAADLPADASKAVTDSRWSIPVAFALGDPLSTLLFGQDFGFDPMTAQRSVGVGTPPDHAAFYGGVDTDGVAPALEDIGYDESGGFLANGEEGAILGGDPNLTGANRVAIEGDDLAIGPFEAPVATAIGREGDPLASADGIAAASDCLGSGALVAQVDDPEDAAADEVALQAIGAEAPTDGDVVPEVLCAVGDPGESLGHVKDCMDGNFNDGGVDPFTNRPYEDELGPADVTEGSTEGTAWVRATIEPDAKDPVGILFNLNAKGVLSGPLGGDPYSFSGPSVTSGQQQALEDQLPDVC